MTRVLTRLIAMSCLLSAPSAAWTACDVSATLLPFGAYNPANVSATDATGTVTVTCTVLVAIGMSWTIHMSTGGSATYSPRQLSNGAERLNYNIYTTSARTTVWGDGSSGTGFISDSVLLAIGTSMHSYTMYGRIPPLQDARAGPYSDAIIVTVTY